MRDIHYRNGHKRIKLRWSEEWQGWYFFNGRMRVMRGDVLLVVGATCIFYARTDELNDKIWQKTGRRYVKRSRAREVFQEFTRDSPGIHLDMLLYCT